MTLTLETPLLFQLTEWGRKRYADYYLARRIPVPSFDLDPQGRVRLTLCEFAQVFGQEFGQDRATVIEGPIYLS